MTAIEPYLGPTGRQMMVAPAPPEDGPRSGDTIDLAGLIGAFRRRLGLFGVVFAVTNLLVLVFLLVTPPQYTATARVAVNDRSIAGNPERVTPVVAQLSTRGGSTVDTEVQLIRSRRVVARVVQMLRLDKDPEFAPRNHAHHNLMQSIALFFAPLKGVSKQDEMINAVLNGLQPVRFQTTGAVDINFTDKDPAKAQRIANAFAQAYLEDQVAAKAANVRAASEALLGQIDVMRQRADDDAAKVQAYKISHNLLSVGAQTLTEQEISTYNVSIAAAKAEVAGDLANLHTAQEQLAHGSDGDDVGATINSAVVSSLRSKHAELSAKLADLQAHYGPKYPDLAQAKSQLADVDSEIHAEIQRIISNLAAKSAVSQERLATLEATLAATKGTLAANTAADAGLQNLVDAANVSKSIYEAYLSRSKEAVAQLSGLQPDAEIVSPAGLPESPSFPIAILFLALGLVAGILFGCAAVVVAEMTEARIITATDVERRLGRRYLGGVPMLGSVSTRKGAGPVDAVVNQQSSAYGEAFRALNAAVGFSSESRGGRVVLITSALPQEGKTTIAAGMARTAALMGAPTVIVDCDARRRGLTQGLKLGGMGPGLLEVLKGEASLFDALVPDVASGAMVLPMGAGDQSAHELLTGEAMSALLEDLRGRYELIVLDTAPVLPVAATWVLAAKADAVVLVVQWRKTREAAVRSALRLLTHDEVQIAGVALSRVDVRQLARYGDASGARFLKKFRDYNMDLSRA